MREWKRTSTEIVLEALPADCRAAFEAHIKKYNLNLTLDKPVMCLKTVSSKIKKGLFSGPGPKATESYIVLLPEWLLWTVSAEGGPPNALSAFRKELSFENYADTPNYSLIQDNGLMVTGKLTGMIGMQGQEHVSMFIGLGDEPVAEKFRAAAMG